MYDLISKIRCNDVTFDSNHFTIFIRSSKTDQYRFGNEVVVYKGDSVACPNMMLTRYLALSGQSTDDQTFI